MSPRSPLALLRTSCLLASSIALVACGGSSAVNIGPPPAPTEFIFASGSAQVSALSVDTSTGALTLTDSIPLGFMENTVGVVATPSASFLYVTDTSNGIDGFSIGQKGTLSAISGSPWLGPGNYYAGGLAVDPAGKFVYAACGCGPPSSLAGFKIDKSTGALTAVAGSPVSVGTDLVQPVIVPSGRFLYVSDILDSQGSVLGFGIDPTSGALTPLSGSPFPTLPLAEPTGLVVHPTGKFLYTDLFVDNSIAAFTIDGITGELTAVAGSPFATGSLSLAGALIHSIATDPAGKFLYVLSDNNSGIIDVLAIDQTTGALTPVNGSPFTISQGAITGGLAVDRSGKFLYIAGGNETSIRVLSIDGSTGAVTALPGLPMTPDFPSDLAAAVVQ